MAAPECHHRFNDLPTIYVQVAEGIADQTGSGIPLAKWDPSGVPVGSRNPTQMGSHFPTGMRTSGADCTVHTVSYRTIGHKICKRIFLSTHSSPTHENLPVLCLSYVYLV